MKVYEKHAGPIFGGVTLPMPQTSCFSIGIFMMVDAGRSWLWSVGGTFSRNRDVCSGQRVSDLFETKQLHRYI